MMKSDAKAVTQLCRYDDKAIFVREHDVCELMGNVGFTDVLFLDIIGRMPSEAERTVIDAVMVSLIEHGMSPSAIAARMTISSAPESLQGAVCAGLAGVGNLLVGSLETCITIIEEIADSEDVPDKAREVVERYKNSGTPVPGFGHPHFKPDDPRTLRLFEIVQAAGLPGRHIAAAKALSKAVDFAYGKHLTMNASAGMAAALGEIGFPREVMRGLVVVCRAAGLVAHVYEEMRVPTTRTIWEATHVAVPYEASE